MKKKSTIRLVVFFVFMCIFQSPTSSANSFARETIYKDSETMGPLTVNGLNTRYFSNNRGNLVYLTGSHTWNNFQDIADDGVGPFDYAAYLDFLEANNHNFIRLWVWEQAAWISTAEGKLLFNPLPYPRTGPGEAIDGDLKFDLSSFNQDYFDRMFSRVEEARKRNIYVAVMLFQGFSIEMKRPDTDSSVKLFLNKILSWLGFSSCNENINNPWKGHPFNVKNNINGINGDPQKRMDGHDIHTLAIPEITRLQEKYVKKTIATLSDLDNVLWEISNESSSASTAWQYHMINFIRDLEKAPQKKHPILMTVQWPGGTNDALFSSSADAVSPNRDGGYRDNTALADGNKVIIVDTDHLWGIGGNWKWVWKSFLRGMNPIFMDPYKIPRFQNNALKSEWDLIRRNMGFTRAFAEKINLSSMVPKPNIASSRYCLAQEGEEYLIYGPQDSSLELDLAHTEGEFDYEWFDPLTGRTSIGGAILGGRKIIFKIPASNDVILHIYRRKRL